MSTLIVEVCEINEILPHPNADRLEIIKIKNWQCVELKGKLHKGQKVVYVPPDAVVPKDLADRWGISKYCAALPKNINGFSPDGLRIKACRLRGEPSFGTVQLPDNLDWEIGKDVKEYYQITKYEPPIKSLDGDAAAPVSSFHCYTDIENIGNFPGVFQDGEEVIFTEKIHGSNIRNGLVYHLNDNGQPEWMWMSGSHGVRRKEFNQKNVRSKYWIPLKESGKDNLKEMILEIKKDKNAKQSVIVFSELFGFGIQDMQYGQNKIVFAVFDISVDNNYLDYHDFCLYTKKYFVPTVPVLYHGAFSMNKVKEFVDGPTTVCNLNDVKEPFKGREGIVIKPVKERHHSLISRVILKSISVDYLERKNKNQTEDH